MFNLKIALFLLVVLVPGFSHAMTPKGHIGKCSGCHSLKVAEANRLIRDLGGYVKKTKMSPVSGLFELTIEKDGRQVVAYMDFGKKYLVPGPIFNLATKKPIADAAIKAPASTKKIDMGKITAMNSIVMGNAKGKNKLFVFTDPDCPFCSKLHLELKKLAAQDHSLAIYIKMFPLQMHPRAFDKARVILGRNSLELLDKAFAGIALPPPTLLDSRKPVDDTINLATSLGITVTPTLILSDGRVVQGYYDAATLRKIISGKM